MECTTAHKASLMVSNCAWDSLPQDQERDADREDEGGWREPQYRFFHGLVPFSLAGDDGGCCSDSGPFFCYRRGDAPLSIELSQPFAAQPLS
ncbi:hypothetical protein AAVH_26262 [Aphelenchoides avenae]|nr:hypothetical protein AAVH_26262 [Aphelenchus avenae]